MEVWDLTVCIVGHLLRYSMESNTYLFPRCVVVNGAEKHIKKVWNKAIRDGIQFYDTDLTGRQPERHDMT